MSAVPTRLENTCEGCGKAFQPHQKSQRFCTPACRYASRYTGAKTARRLRESYTATALAEALRGWARRLTDGDGELTA